MNGKKKDYNDKGIIRTAKMISIKTLKPQKASSGVAEQQKKK